MPAARCLAFPVAVSRNRFLVPLCVFCLGMTAPFRPSIVKRGQGLGRAQRHSGRVASSPGPFVYRRDHRARFLPEGPREFAILRMGEQTRKRNSVKNSSGPTNRSIGRVIYVTAGAGGMYCGSCLRDNTLVRALRGLGVDASLVPVYTPIRTDEPDASEERLFFGGIDLYLRHQWRWFRSLPRWATRWLDQPGLVRRVARRSVETDATRLGPLTLTMLAGADGPLRPHVRELVDWLRNERPSVVNLSNLLIGGCLPEIKRQLDVPVVVTLQGDDLFLDQLAPEYRAKVLDRLRELARSVDRFIVFSEFYQRKMRELLCVPDNRFDRVPLGIDVSDWTGLTRVPEAERAPTVGYLARAAPEKGLGVLIDAWIRLKRGGMSGDLGNCGLQQWRLAVAGWKSEPERPYVLEQRRKLAEAGLEEEVSWWGEVDREQKRAFLGSIDLLCVPATYAEPKGLFVLESLAAGVPVLVPAHGAFPEMLAELGGGWLIPRPEPDEVSKALGQRLADRSALRRAGEAGRDRVVRLRTAERMAQATLEAYRQACGGKG